MFSRGGRWHLASQTCFLAWVRFGVTPINVTAALQNLLLGTACVLLSPAPINYRVLSIQLLFHWCHLFESLWKWIWCINVLINRSNPAIASAGRAGHTLLYINLIPCVLHPPELSCFFGLFPFYSLCLLSWCCILLSDVFPACPWHSERSPVTTTRSCLPRPLAAAAGPALGVVLPPAWTRPSGSHREPVGSLWHVG